MGKRRYQAFVSSTYKDLIEERKEVTQAILENDCFPAGMELFPASNKKQWDVIKKVIDESDFYIVISAGKYGSKGCDDDGKETGFTEMEFDYAVKTGKPIYAFLHKDIDKLPRESCEITDEGTSRLIAFRKKLENGRVVKYWRNKEELHAAVGNAISQLLKDDNNGLVGWIRADTLTESSVGEKKVENHNSTEYEKTGYTDGEKIVLFYIISKQSYIINKEKLQAWLTEEEVDGVNVDAVLYLLFDELMQKDGNIRLPKQYFRRLMSTKNELICEYEETFERYKNYREKIFRQLWDGKSLSLYEQLFALYISENRMYTLGDRWMAIDQIESIKKWEAKHFIGNELSSCYDDVLRSYKEKKLVYPSAYTTYDNPREYTLYGSLKNYLDSPEFKKDYGKELTAILILLQNIKKTGLFDQ